jgi:1-acyl-sn-glycerol-3-phosphate acyltransferase
VIDHQVPSSWLPLSPCTPTCLPPPAVSAGLTRALRLVAIAAVLLTALVTVPVVRRGPWLSACCRGLLRAVGVRLRVPGGARDWRGVLVVANHVSWIDVLALTALSPVRLVAKREVGQWPLIGRLARSAGALFIDRAALRALPGTIAELTDALGQGDAVGVFPEGTTWCGLHDSMLRVLRTPGLTCELTILPDVAPIGDRRSLARRAEAAVALATGIEHGTPPPVSSRHDVLPYSGARLRPRRPSLPPTLSSRPSLLRPTESIRAAVPSR